MKCLWIVLIFIVCPAWGAELFPSLAKPGEQKTVIRMMGMLTPSVPSGDSSNQTSAIENDVSANIPIYQTKEDVVTLNAGEHWLGLNTNGILPSSGTLVPSNFYDYQIGAGYQHALENPGRFVGGQLNFGSPSDSPFTSTSVDVINATALYTVASDATSSWSFLLNYSNNRPYLNNIPLPFFAYTYMPSPDFRGSFGIPFLSVMWKPGADWTLNVFSVIPWVVRADIAYSVYFPIQVFVGYDASQELFIRSNRTDSLARLYYDQRKLHAGIRSPVSRAVFVILEGGYDYGRSIFEAESFNNPINGKLILGECWSTTLKVNAMF